MSVELNKKVPDFTAETQHGTIHLSDFKGRYVVLYFYPRDNTSGCTLEAQNFRDLLPQFQALDVEVIGVSRDTLKSHDKFIEKQNLNFTLIADPDEVLCEAFDVMKQKKMYGKQVRGIERSTFIIDPKGVLCKEWRKVKVPNHAQEVLDYLKEIL